MEVVANLVSTLTSFVFNLVVTFFDLIFLPIVSVVMALFPDVSDLVNNMFYFIDTYIVPYIKFGLSFLYNLVGLPPQSVYILMTYFIAMITAKYIMVAVNFAINVYQKLKP